MPKKLKAIRNERCNGCDLCVFEAQRQLSKVGLDGSLIRIFRKKDPKSEYLVHDIEIDPRIGNLNILKIKQICPRNGLDVVEVDDGDTIQKDSGNKS